MADDSLSQSDSGVSPDGASVLTLRPVLTLEQALADAQSVPPKELIAVRLATRWGWPRKRTNKMLAQWRADGALPAKAKHKPSKRGPRAVKDAPSVQTLGPTLLPAATMAATAADSMHEKVGLPAIIPVQPTPPQQVARPRRAVRDVLIALVFGLAALALAVIGVCVNAKYWGAFGQSPDAVMWLAVMGVAVDVLTLVTPSAAFRLWANGRYLGALAAWIFWVGFLAMTVLATSGWSATNVGDAIAGREMSKDLQAALVEKWKGLRTELGATTEGRSVAEITQALIAAQATAGRVYDRTDGCTDVGRNELIRCDAVIRLREAKAEAQRRDELRVEIDQVSAKLSTAGVIKSGDPGAEMVARIVPWLTRDLVTPTDSDIARVRIVALSLAPAVGGVLLGLAELMARGKKRA
jgi:hypothetical protein